jgi:hypothetical protein
VRHPDVIRPEGRAAKLCAPILLLITLVACREESAPAPAVRAAVPSASASANLLPLASVSASAPKPQPPLLELVAEPVTGDLAKRRVSVDGTTLAEVAFPHTCSAFLPGPDEWRVSCTPRFRTPLISARREGGEVVITQGKQVLRRPLAAGQAVGAPATIEPRPAPCADEGAHKPVKVTFRSNNFYPGHEPRSPFQLLVGGKSVLSLVEDFMWWKGCKHARDAAAVTITCERDQHAARIWTEGPVVHFTWRDDALHRGAVLLPCDRPPELADPECFNCNNAYF